MQTVTYGIPSWSHKTFRARNNYCCDNCGGTIPRGVVYLRHVVRDGAKKGVDPLRNLHVHLDCEAPWYQADNATHLLRNTGRLSKRTTEKADGAEITRFSPTVFLNDEKVGTLQWHLPKKLGEQVSTGGTGIAAVAEMEQAITIILRALAAVAGDKRRAMRLNNLLVQMADDLA